MLRKRIVKTVVAWLMVSSHLFILGFIVYAKTESRLTFNEMSTTLALVGPLFAGYTTAIVSYVIKHQGGDAGDETRVTITYAAFAILFSLGFAIALWLAIYGRAWLAWFASFEEFKTYVGVLEAAFGIYAGSFIYTLFDAPGAARVGHPPAGS